MPVYCCWGKEFDHRREEQEDTVGGQSVVWQGSLVIFRVESYLGHRVFVLLFKLSWHLGE